MTYSTHALIRHDLARHMLACIGAYINSCMTCLSRSLLNYQTETVEELRELEKQAGGAAPELGERISTPYELTKEGELPAKFEDR